MVVLNDRKGLFRVDSPKCIFDAIKWHADYNAGPEVDDSVLLNSLSKIQELSGIRSFPAVLEVKVMEERIYFSPYAEVIDTERPKEKICCNCKSVFIGEHCIECGGEYFDII